MRAPLKTAVASWAPYYDIIIIIIYILLSLLLLLLFIIIITVWKFCFKHSIVSQKRTKRSRR